MGDGGGSPLRFFIERICGIIRKTSFLEARHCFIIMVVWESVRGGGFGFRDIGLVGYLASTEEVGEAIVIAGLLMRFMVGI